MQRERIGWLSRLPIAVSPAEDRNLNEGVGSVTEMLLGDGHSP